MCLSIVSLRGYSKTLRRGFVRCAGRVRLHFLRQEFRADTARRVRMEEEWRMRSLHYETSIDRSHLLDSAKTPAFPRMTPNSLLYYEETSLSTDSGSHRPQRCMTELLLLL